ncbi:MAG: hypothetical protein ACREQ4_12565 [Candidatus Binataceae bacterium]
MLKYLFVLGWCVLFVAMLALVNAHAADMGMQLAPGSQFNTFADVTVDTSCEQVLADGHDRRIDAVLCDSGTTSARCGGMGMVSASRGTLLSPSSCQTWPTSAAISCCSTTGTTTIAPGEIVR